MQAYSKQEVAAALKDNLGLKLEPVAVSCVDASKAGSKNQKKTRICQAFEKAAKGSTEIICRENNLCFGAAWHLGFHKIHNPKIIKLIKKFVVEGEKLFASYQALDKLMAQMEEIPDNKNKCFVLTPLEKAELEPELVIFLANPEEVCRLLTLVTFSDGIMPEIKIGGPTCRMIIIYPLVTGRVNISFYDYTARKFCAVEKDKLLVSIPYKKLPQIIENIEKCTAGCAKIEYPPQFRAILQKSLGKES